MPSPPFHDFARSIQPQTPLRDAITAACAPARNRVRAAAVGPGQLAADSDGRAPAHWRPDWSRRCGPRRRRGGVEGLIHEYSLRSQEGVALMCLAEALLRIPDDADARRADPRQDRRRRLARAISATARRCSSTPRPGACCVTGRLTATSSEREPVGRADPPDRARRRAADPQGRRYRHADDGRAVRHRPDHRRGAGEQPRAWRRKGFRYSYDMLGEAARHGRRRRALLRATTSRRSTPSAAPPAGRGIYEGPGISIKLSALHPRYCARPARARDGRAAAAPEGAGRCSRTHYDIGLNIDAEEADRLELSLDLLERLCFEPELAGWNGIGFVVQAYQKRAPSCSTTSSTSRRRSGRRLMVRLVKGAYWDSEIKRAQVDGLEDFPVFTRKVHTDVSYLACARKLLAAPDAVFPQFATHNAQTLATIHAMAGGELLRRPVRVPVPARHGRAALRGGGRPGQAQPALPHLRAGRHARDAARLSGAPAAGERRQHLLRQPHRRPERSRSTS